MTDHKGEAKTKGDLLANDAFPLMYMGDPSNSKDVADQLKAIAQVRASAYDMISQMCIAISINLRHLQSTE